MAKESWYINESELDDYHVRIVSWNLNSVKLSDLSGHFINKIR